VPLLIEGQTVGVMNLTSLDASSGFDEESTRTAETIANDAAVAIYRAQLFEQSCTEPQTGLFVGQVVEALLESEVTRARRYGSRLSVIACFLAPFPEPETLEAIGTVFRRTMRKLVDMAGHFGEGWFGMVLPETDGSGAQILCERLAQALTEAVPDIKTRRFIATEWRDKEKAYICFERAVEGLEAFKETEKGTQVRLL